MHNRYICAPWRLLFKASGIVFGCPCQSADSALGRLGTIANAPMRLGASHVAPAIHGLNLLAQASVWLQDLEGRLTCGA